MTFHVALKHTTVFHMNIIETHMSEFTITHLTHTVRCAKTLVAKLYSARCQPPLCVRESHRYEYRQTVKSADSKSLEMRRNKQRNPRAELSERDWVSRSRTMPASPQPGVKGEVEQGWLPLALHKSQTNSPDKRITSCSPIIVSESFVNHRSTGRKGGTVEGGCPTC